MKRMITVFAIAMGLCLSPVWGQSEKSSQTVKVSITKSEDGTTVVLDTIVGDLENAEKLIQLEVEELEKENGEIEVQIKAVMDSLEWHMEELDLREDELKEKLKRVEMLEEMKIDVVTKLDDGTQVMIIKDKSPGDRKPDEERHPMIWKQIDSASGEHIRVEKIIIIDDEDMNGSDGKTVEKKIRTKIITDGVVSATTLTIVIREAKIAEVDPAEDKELTKIAKKVGAENTELELSSLKFYPNPSDGQFTLEAELKELGELGIKVYDLKGTLVHDVTIKSDERHINTEIDMRGHPAGTYLMMITQNGAALSKKLILK